MRFSTRFVALLVIVMLAPVLSIGVILWLTAGYSGLSFIASPPTALWIPLILIGIVLVSGFLVIIILSHSISAQLSRLINVMQAVAQGRQPSLQSEDQKLLQEFRPLYVALRQHLDFCAHLRKTLAEVVQCGSGQTLALRSEDDELVRVLNILIARIDRMQRLATAVARGDLREVHALEVSQVGPDAQIQELLTNLGNVLAKARSSTNHIARATSQIDSITEQGVQDTKGAIVHLDTVLESICHITTNIQHAAEDLHEYVRISNGNSTAIEPVSRSITEVTKLIEALKQRMETASPAAFMSEHMRGPLNALEKAVTTIEHYARAGELDSQNIADDVQAARNAIQQTIEGISRMQHSMETLFAIFAHLGEHAEEVNESLTAINDIAEHTNLLSINAAIISAHAGEHGRDFAVIADEVGKFSERTHEATSEIEELLRAIQTEIGNAAQAMEETSKTIADGVAFTHRAGNALETVASGVHKTTEQFENVVTASGEQIQTSSRIRMLFDDGLPSPSNTQEHLNFIIQPLTQILLQLREISSGQAATEARMTTASEALEQLTHDINLVLREQIDMLHQLTKAVTSGRRLTNRTMLGSEKIVQLTEELSTQGGHLAVILGEVALSDRVEIHDTQEGGHPVVGFVKRGPDRFFDEMGAGIRRQAALHGFQVVELDSQYEVTMQVEDVNRLLKYPDLQGLILCPVDTHVAHKLAQDVLQHHIACVSADESLPAIISVRSGNREGGRRAAELFREHLSPGVVIGVLVDRAVLSMKRRLEGFRAQAELDGFDVVELYCDISQPEEIGHYLLSGLEENPEMQGLFLPNETVTTAYLTLLHQGKMPVKTLQIVGYDRTTMAEEALQTGELLGAIFQHPEEIGQQAFQYLWRLMRKELRAEQLEDTTIYIPTVKVTREMML